MDKIEAARHGQGLIELEPDSADLIQEVVEQVSRITGREDNQLHFEGQRIVEGHGFGRAVNCYDVYECPRGFLLHTYMNQGPDWATAGKTLEAMLAAAPDRSVARRAHGELIKKGYFSIHH